MKTEPSATTGLDTYGMLKCHFCARVGALAGVMAGSAVRDVCAGPPRNAGQSVGPTAQAEPDVPSQEPATNAVVARAAAVLRPATFTERLMRSPPLGRRRLAVSGLAPLISTAARGGHPAAAIDPQHYAQAGRHLVVNSRFPTGE